MTSFWKRTILLSTLGLITAAVLLFASNLTSRLHDSQRRVHAGATREPQSADPADAYVEVTLETSPLAQLSSGYTGIAPSMHMIRLGSARPLSNIDPIEHPARRRWGRIDFSFAFLIYLPIAIIPLTFTIYRKCTNRGDIDKLVSGRTTIFDFSIERILLPLLASGGFVALVTLGCLYSAGVRLSTNDTLARISLWIAVTGLYLLGWVLLYAYLLLRTRSFPMATIYYGAMFLLVAFLLPQFLQSAAIAIERPRGRLPLVVERRKLGQQVRRDDRDGIDRFLERKGFPRLDWSQLLTQAQFAAIKNLLIEEQVLPRLREFENTVQTLDHLALYTSWLSPYLVAQFGVDDLAGTGLARYSRFRIDSIAYHEQWRNYTLGFLARRQYLDFDAMKAIPRFAGSGEDTSPIFQQSFFRCLYLGAFCILLTIGIRRRLLLILPKSGKAAR